MIVKTDNEQTEYDAPRLDILNGLAQKKPNSGHRQETWEQARERLGHLPEPERSQQLAMLDRLQSE